MNGTMMVMRQWLWGIKVDCLLFLSCMFIQAALREDIMQAHGPIGTGLRIL